MEKFDLLTVCKNAKTASKQLLTLSQEKINQVLFACAENLIKNTEYLIEENALDLANAQEKGLSAGFIDRLTLTEKVIEGIALGIKQVAGLNSPIGKVVYTHQNLDQDISIEKINVPFGVIGIIFESRPNVTADAFALTFKTQNAVILKGGSDAINSNRAIVKVLRDAITELGVNPDVISLIDDTSRETTLKFMKMNNFVDLLIPRGSAKLIKSTLENSTIPIIETGTGNCHVYVDSSADIDMATNVIFNAKTQRYSVCNACESIVIHKDILEKALPKIANKLLEKCVEIRCDEISYNVIKDYKYLAKATEEDFYTEYGDAIISVKVVDSVSSAIEHINEHSTKHSESIITENKENADYFMQMVDSSCVYHNASTRFSDGFVFGLGAEIGISTQKLHARGPMGLDGLVTTKYIVKGNGSVRK